MYVSACPGGANFDCLETAISSYSTVNARLFTKLAGSGFSFDVVALRDSAGTVETAYVGIDGVAKAVTVELVDASNTVIGTQSVTFAAGNTTGRTTTSTYTINTASPSVGCKVTDSVASKVGTSTDRFSIRPIAFAVSSTNATNTGTSGTPIFKAGSDSFNLTATALAGYNGTPLIDSTLLIGTPTADSISGNFGAAAAATGIAVGNAFTYSEVGNLGMQANAVYDGSFTAIDQSNDCTNDFSTSLVGGKYGCKIGSQAVAQTTGSSGFGRFIPDHFTLISSSVPSVFSYMGQPFKAHYAIEARNGSTPSMKTSNYSGAYAPGVASVAAENANSGTDLVVSLAPRITGLTGSWSNGIYSVSVANNATFARGTEPDGPYDTLVLGVKVTDTDGPTLQALDMNPTTDVTDVACVSGGIVTNCTHKMIGTLTSIRYGRLRLQNAFGSERLPLTVPAEVQYYNVDHWATNMLDGSSPPTPWGVSPAVSTALLGGTGNATPSLGTTLVSGKASLSASAPGTGTYGYLDLTVTVPDYLKFPWTGGSAIDPTARVTFGIYKGNDRIIYRREIR
jgi:MSHA biogenesis protein MshQ